MSCAAKCPFQWPFFSSVRKARKIKCKKQTSNNKIPQIYILKEIEVSKWASLVAQMVKNPPAMHETWVQSLDWEDPLEKGMATHSCLENPPSGLQSMGLQSRTRRSD